jgi:hypothetical protein
LKHEAREGSGQAVHVSPHDARTRAFRRRKIPIALDGALAKHCIPGESNKSKIEGCRVRWSHIATEDFAMPRISVPEFVLAHMSRCAEKGDGLGEALASLLKETGPIGATLMNLGHEAEEVRIYCAGVDFLIIGIPEGKDFRRAVAPLSAIQWIDFADA